MVCLADVEEAERVQKTCSKLTDLAGTYEPGDRATAGKILRCANTLVDEGVVTDEQCQQLVRDPLIQQCGQL